MESISENEVRAFPEDWEIVELSRVASIRYGLGQPPREDVSGIPIIRATNVKRGDISTEGLIRVDPTDIPSSRKAFLKSGEILVVRSGAYTGDVALVTKEWEGSVAGYDLVVKPLPRVNSEFLLYALLSRPIQAYFRRQRGRSAQPHLNANELGSAHIPIPPLAQQTNIASVLSSIRRKIKREKAEEVELRQLYNTILHDLMSGRTRLVASRVTASRTVSNAKNSIEVVHRDSIPNDWITVPVGEIVERSFGGGTPATDRNEFWNGNIPWITSAMIGQDDIYVTRAAKTISSKGLDESAAQLAVRGSVLVGTRVGVGKCAVTTFDVAISQDLSCLVVKQDSVVPEYLAFLFKCHEYRAWFGSNKRGVTIKGIPRQDLLSLLVPLPSLIEQQEIVKALSKVLRTQQSTRAIIENSVQLYDTLLNGLLTGRIRLSDKELEIHA